MKRIRVSPITTDASGNASVLQSTGSVLGLLYAVQLVDGTFDDGVDVTITAEQGELSIPLFAMSNFNVDLMKFPRVSENSATDGTDLTSACMPLVAGNIKVVIAQGGNVKTGAVILYIID